MTRTIILAALGVITALPLAAEERRELGAHEHGHSTMNVAIEGERVEIELISPGMDIVGFEHAAGTAEQKAAIAEAETILQDPLALFVLSPEAGCTTESAAVDLEAEEAHEEQHAEEGAHEEEEHAGHDGEESHTEFHAEYAIICASPDDLGGIEFVFFDRFPGAEEIEVTVITEHGQTSYEVERAAPRIDLKGLI